jgi:hypothetical protein
VNVVSPGRSIAYLVAAVIMSLVPPELVRPLRRSQPAAALWRREMLLKVAVALLIAWLLGVLGLYRLGDFVHLLLLVGLTLLLLGILRARDAALAAHRRTQQMGAKQ